jgi:hypothetical protein
MKNKQSLPCDCGTNDTHDPIILKFPIIVKQEPIGYLSKLDNYEEAERARDWNETFHEHACRVVRWADSFYVVWADDSLDNPPNDRYIEAVDRYFTELENERAMACVEERVQ